MGFVFNQGYINYSSPENPLGVICTITSYIIRNLTNNVLNSKSSLKLGSYLTDQINISSNLSEYYKNILHVLEKSNLATTECIFSNSMEQGLLSSVRGASELIGKGWEKEAIPVFNKKKSFISGFFSRLFS